MADISAEISAFQSAVYGEEVRGSMISLAEKLNDVCEANEDDIADFGDDITAALADASTATANANSAASTANTAAASATSAASSANSAAATATAAGTDATQKATAAQNLINQASSAESARVAAESARVTAENARVTAENSRASADANRTSNEATRQENESGRNTAESARITAEASRAANETQRQNGEVVRTNAESSRVSAFAAIQAAWADMEQQVLPPATYSTLGGVIIDAESGLEVDSDGTLSFTAGDFLTTTEAAATYATLTDLAGKAASSHTHAATDVTSGTLAVARGGTGVATAAAERERLGLGSTTGALPIANGGTGQTTAANALDALLGSSPLPASKGGTGAATLTSNSILTGNGTSAVGEVATASGALYATSSGGAASFGTLPVAQGGTGLTASPSMLTDLSSTTAADVMAASPRPGVTGALPVANGGTGASTVDGARQALNASREWYATSSTAAATAAKTASCTGFVLEAGAAVNVRFANENTAALPTLNVNSTGAKAIYANNSTTAANCKWMAGETVHFVYDGTYWRMANSVAINSLRESVSFTYAVSVEFYMVSSGNMYIKLKRSDGSYGELGVNVSTSRIYYTIHDSGGTITYSKSATLS